MVGSFADAGSGEDLVGWVVVRGDGGVEAVQGTGDDEDAAITERLN